MKTDSWPNALTDFLVATSLLSRLPMPRLPDSAFESSARATWAYPLVGVLVGAIAALAGHILLATGLPAIVAAGICIALLMALTGAMHEDGLADVADGFWGGYSAERRLEIMKDSQIGTFGTLALLVTTGLRWTGYSVLLQQNLLAVIAVAALSRAVMPALMWALPHARKNGLSRRVGQPEVWSVSIAAVIGLCLSILVLGAHALPVALAVSVTGFMIGKLAHLKIGGQSGDVLGAAQQASETAALLTLLAIL